jgi:hypothetical protein
MCLLAVLLLVDSRQQEIFAIEVRALSIADGEKKYDEWEDISS